MREIRRAQLDDLAVVASWLCNDADCALWAGRRVSFPVDLPRLPDAIEWVRSESWSVTCGGDVIAFGQVVPKARHRMHLARLITAPGSRGSGVGRQLAAHLLDTARSMRPAAISLNVVPENEPALILYRSLGFVEAPRPFDEPESSSTYMQHLA